VRGQRFGVKPLTPNLSQSFVSRKGRKERREKISEKDFKTFESLRPLRPLREIKEDIPEKAGRA